MSNAIHGLSFTGAAGALAASITADAGLLSTCPASLARVIIDDDLVGASDGPFSLAYHLLCPSIRIELISGSYLPMKFGGPRSANEGTAGASELLKMMKPGSLYLPVPGSELPIGSRSAWRSVPATAAIVREARRDDTGEPPFYAADASPDGQRHVSCRS